MTSLPICNDYNPATHYRYDALAAYFKNGLLINKGLPNITKLAAQLNLSPRYLSDLLKQETGKTPNQFKKDLLN